MVEVTVPDGERDTTSRGICQCSAAIFYRSSLSNIGLLLFHNRAIVHLMTPTPTDHVWMHPCLAAPAYIFDNDGTLVDTESIWIEAYVRLLSRYGIEHSLAIHRSMMGLSPRDCVLAMQRAYPGLPQGDDATDQLLQERRRLFQEARAEQGIHLLPGVVDFLAAAHQQGKRLAMATSASREDIATQLDLLGWRDRFEVIVTADDIRRHKPAPDVYLEAARQLGVEPSHCLAFEDAANGLLSAKAAGMPVVFVRDARFQMEAPFEPALTVASFMEF